MTLNFLHLKVTLKQGHGINLAFHIWESWMLAVETDSKHSCQDGKGGSKWAVVNLYVFSIR